MNALGDDGDGLAAVELAIRTAMGQLGASLLEGLRCQEASCRWDEIIWTKVNTQTSAA